MRFVLASLSRIRFSKQGTSGFTLVELLIAMLVTGVALTAVYTSHAIQQKAYTVQREAARMEANLRAAMNVIKNDLRNSGRCGQMSQSACNFQFISNSRRFDVANPATIDPVDGVQGITLSMAKDDKGAFGPGTPKDGYADLDSLRTIRYFITEPNGDGRRELHRVDSDAPPLSSTLVADGIYDMCFAFAYDNDNDDVVDRAPPLIPGTLGRIIWAVDDDNDSQGKLDVNLDNVQDGIVDDNDDGDGDGKIDNVDGPLPAQIPLNDARAVRIWLLARSNRQYADYSDNRTYQVGYRTFDPEQEAQNNNNNANRFRYLLMESAVHLRNHE